MMQHPSNPLLDNKSKAPEQSDVSHEQSRQNEGSIASVGDPAPRSDKDTQSTVNLQQLQSPPPFPPPSGEQLQSPSRKNKNTLPVKAPLAEHTVSFTTEDETSADKIKRKLPSTPKERSASNQEYRMTPPHGDSGQIHTSLEHIAGGYPPSPKVAPSLVKQMKSHKQGTDEQTKELKGEDASVSFSDDAAKPNLGETAWSRLDFEIRCQKQPPIRFDATKFIVPPVKLQFALQALCRADISVDELKKHGINVHFENHAIVFTCENKGLQWTEQQVKEDIINILESCVLTDIECLTVKKGRERGFALVENIKKTELTMREECRIVVYELQNDLYIVGSKADLKILRHCLHIDLQPGNEWNEAFQRVYFKTFGVSSDDIACMTELNIFNDIKSYLPGIQFLLSDEPSVSGSRDNVRKAVDMIDKFRKSVVKRNVTFRERLCINVFLNEDGTVNSALCSFVKGQVLNNKDIKIHKCHIDVTTMGPPKVVVCCLSQEEATAAAEIISGCLCTMRLAKNAFQKIKKEDLKEWTAKKKIYIGPDSDEDILLITTCDIYQRFNELFAECATKQPKPLCRTADNIQTVLLSNVTRDEFCSLRELYLLEDITNSFPDVKMTFSNGVEITGIKEDVQKAEKMLIERRKSVVKKMVTFKEPSCANLFVKTDRTKNEGFCDFVKHQVLNKKNYKIQKCHIEVCDGKPPSVTVCCLSEEETEFAGSIISDCLHVKRISKVTFDKALTHLKKLIERKMVYVLPATDEEVCIVTNCDAIDELNSIITKHVETTTEVPVPSFVIAYFEQFGSETLETAKTKYNVSILLKDSSLILTGNNQNLKETKHFIKTTYALERFYIDTDQTLIDEQRSTLNSVAQKYQCCWTLKIEKGGEKALRKNINYQASWIDYITNAKLTLIEGSAGRLECDVLLVFVTDSLFPIPTETQLGDGFHKLVNFSSKEIKPAISEKKPLGMICAYPKAEIHDSFSSKEVMYVVTQKTNIPTESQNIFLLENLRQFVEQNWCYNRVLSVGVPVENDDFECVNKTCEELVFAWKQTWRQLEKLPEIFICSSNNNSGKMMVTIDRIFENSRGFAKRGFAFPEEGGQLQKNKNIEVKVKVASLLNAETDAIVNTTARNLDLTAGNISKLIMTNAGDTVQEECNRKYPGGIQYAEVAVTSAGDLQRLAKIKNILHSSLPCYTRQNHEQAIEFVRHFVRNCLYQAERLNIKSIAFPALGTGKLSYPGRDVAQAMFDAVDEFKKEAVNPGIRKIYFIVHESDVKLCDVFQNEEWRRNDGIRGKDKDTGNSTNNSCLKKTVNIDAAPVVFTVSVGMLCPPSHFVEVDVNDDTSGSKQNVTECLVFKSARTQRPTWNDKLLLHENIVDEKRFKQMVKNIVRQTEQDRITSIVFFPLVTSSFHCAVGEQIQWFTDGVVSFCKDTLWQKVPKYLREVQFSVDESGFINAESHLLVPVISRKLWNIVTGDTSWKKGPICEADTRVSLNVIGANKTKIQVAMTEMQAVLNDAQVARQKAKVDSNKHTPVKTQEPVKLSEIEKKEYEQKGARPKQMETLKKCSSITSARKFGITKGSQVKYHTEKGTGHSSYNLDKLDVTCIINRGIIDYLKAKGEDKLFEWEEQVRKVFQVQCVATKEKITITGSFFQVQKFQDYLNTIFPRDPEELGAAGDKDELGKIKIKDENNELEMSVVSNSEDGIVYQYHRNSILISIYKGNITNVRVDCIVSSASSYLSGVMGIEKAIMDVGGDEVEKDCVPYKQKNKMINSGCSILTRGGNLNCKKIIHYVLPQTSKQDHLRKVEDAFHKCIYEAETQGLHSVAIPALGTGFGVYKDVIAKSFHDAVLAYCTQRRTQSSLTHIHFVDKNYKSVKSVMDTFTSDFKCLKINRTTVYVSQGAVTTLKANAFVVFQDSAFSINYGIAKKVADLSDDSYTAALTLFKEQAANIGRVFVCKASGELANLCNDVLSAVVLQSLTAETHQRKTSTAEIKATMKEILVKSEKLKTVTLGVPIFESEELKSIESINAIAEMVFEYFYTTEVSTIKEIHFFNEDSTLVANLITCIQKQVTKIEGLKKEHGLSDSERKWGTRLVTSI